MYEFLYDYVKPKYGENEKICSMDTDSLIIRVKTDDIYKNIVRNIETWLDTSNFDIDKLLPKENNKKGIGLMKDELSGQIIKEFVGLRARIYSY